MNLDGAESESIQPLSLPTVGIFTGAMRVLEEARDTFVTRSEI